LQQKVKRWPVSEAASKDQQELQMFRKWWGGPGGAACGGECCRKKNRLREGGMITRGARQGVIVQRKKTREGNRGLGGGLNASGYSRGKYDGQ